MFPFPYEPDYMSFRDVPMERIADVRRRYNLSCDRRYLIYSGRLVPVKRVELLIRAYTSIADERPLWDLIIAGDGPLRFSRVLERVESISQKALTHALRTLESDGLLTRTLYPQVPPRVEYELTPLGRDLLTPLASLWRWIAGRLPEFAAAQAPRRDL